MQLILKSTRNLQFLDTGCVESVDRVQWRAVVWTCSTETKGHSVLYAHSFQIAAYYNNMLSTICS